MNRYEDRLRPISSKIKRRKFLTVDIESKAGDTQTAGFTRPFLIGVYDGEHYEEFRNEDHLRVRNWEERHILPGGCVDKTLNYLLNDRFRGYQFYAHNGGNFDHLFWLAWLKKHEQEFSFEVVPVQSSIQKIQVTRRSELDDLPVFDAGERKSGVRLAEEEEEEEDDGVTRKRRKRRKPEASWTFLDSMKLFPSTLQKMLETFGLASKVQHDLNLHEEDPTWSHYLSRDCIGLYEALTKLHDLVEKPPEEGGLGGEVGMTAPATAMKLFRRRFLGRGDTPDDIPRHTHFGGCPDRGRRYKKGELPACPGCCHTFVRRAYYGGRTEVLEARGTNLHYYDINSSYVAAMRESMPAGDRLVEESPLHIDWRRHENFVGFAECDVEIPPDCDLPPLPHRAIKTGKLIFPAGRFHGVWDLEELKLLAHPLVRGRVLRVDKVVWFKRRYLFKEMVDVLWSLRDPRNPGYDEGLSALAKLMGNSTYGKFGMKEERTQIVFRQELATEHQCFLCLQESIAPGGLCRECEGSKPATGDPECDVWYQRKRVDAPYIIPQIAAHITSLARKRIWEFLVCARELGGRLMYADTDSVITTAALPKARPDSCRECHDWGFCLEHPVSTILGALKDEYPGKMLEGLFVQPKVYMIRETEASAEERMRAWDENLIKSVYDELPTPPPCPERGKEKVTMKGFPRDVRTKENLEALQGGKVLEFSRLEKVRTLARRRFGPSPQMAGVKKSFKGSYDKRIMRADGTTVPLVLDELDWGEAAE